MMKAHSPSKEGENVSNRLALSSLLATTALLASKRQRLQMGAFILPMALVYLQSIIKVDST